MVLECNFSKIEILEFYFNCIYLGVCVFGVEVVSQCYFDKFVIELSLVEVVLFVVLFKVLLWLDFMVNLEVVQVCVVIVFDVMLDVGFIDQVVYDDVIVNLAVLVEFDIDFQVGVIWGYFFDYVVLEVECLLGLENIFDLVICMMIDF